MSDPAPPPARKPPQDAGALSPPASKTGAPPPARRAGRGRRLGSRLLRGAAIVAGCVLLLWLGLDRLRAWQEAESAFPRVDGRLTVAGLGAPLAIARDARGTPHVDATNPGDALFGLGFAHAQDRLAQMVWLVRSARGRAAELVGPDALPADRAVRLLGIGSLAERETRRLDPETRRLLEAYAAGVNAWITEIARGAAEPPLALARVGVTPEPWRPADSIALVKLYAWNLGNTVEATLLLSDVIEALGGAEAPLYFPEAGGGAPRPRESEVRAPVAPVPRDGPAATGFVALARAMGLWGSGVGSSAILVPGAHSASGRPLLAVDAHHEATAPALLYEAHVEGGSLDVAGATLPGVPVFWSGRNRHVAWGSTHAGAVTTDLLVETLDRSGERYLDGGWRPLLRRSETIAVRGGEPVVLEVRESARGPLLAPLLAREREPLAVAWTGALPGNGVGALLRAARATSAAGFRAALAAHHEPVLAFVFADEDGAGGMQVAGGVPQRGADTGLAPAPARGEGFVWRGTLPAHALPAASLGAGFLVAADRTAARAGAVRGEWLWRPGDRAARIETLLREASARGPLELRQLAVIQTDVASVRAPEIVRDALVLAGDPAALGAEAREVATLLAAWDGSAAADSVGAALYHAFLERLVHDALEVRLGADLAARYLALREAHPVHVVASLVAAAARRPEPAADALADERGRLAEIIRRSLRETWLWLSVHAGPNREKWAWGRLHRVTFRPVGAAALLGAAPASLGPFPIGGSTDTIACAGWERGAPFDVTVASTWRFAIDASQLDQGLSSLAPGESEHFDHPHAADGVERWLAGRPRLLVASRLLIDETTRSRLELEPAAVETR